MTTMVEVMIDGRWRGMLDPIWPNDGYKRRGEEPFVMAPVIGRHYALYSVLADVRNQSGRGTVTHMVGEYEGHKIEYDYDTDDGGHDPLEFISVPKGVPEDANQAWREFTKQEMLHDPSWLTLAEIEAGPWDQYIYEQAIAYEDEYVRWKEKGEAPTMHARSVGGPGLEVVNEVEYAAGKRGPQQTAVDFRWKGNTVREDVGRSWWLTVAIMRMIAPNQDPNRVRLLFVFDS
jgi:hypothetical protein